MWSSSGRAYFAVCLLLAVSQVSNAHATCGGFHGSLTIKIHINIEARLANRSDEDPEPKSIAKGANSDDYSNEDVVSGELRHVLAMVFRYIKGGDDGAALS